MAETSNWYNIGYRAKAGDLGINKPPHKEAWEQVQDMLMQKQKEIDTEKNAESEAKKKQRNTFAQKLSNDFVEFASDPSFGELGQESYQKAQAEVEALRNEMFAAIDAEDSKAQADIMVRLNKIKQRHANDAEQHKTIIASWEDKQSVSAEAMTEEGLSAFDNFANNETKRVVYDENNTLYYEWDRLDEETGVMVTERYSSKELDDLIVIKDTVNGEKVLDYGQELKLAVKNKTFPKDDEILHEIGNMIPQDKKGLRDWFYGNPADTPGLNIENYLRDMLTSNYNTFDKLGVNLQDYPEWDVPGSEPGVQLDEVPQAFRDQLIEKIMNVEDVEQSHKIMVDIHANLLKNDALDPTKNDRFDYRAQNDKGILGSEVDGNMKEAADKEAKLEALYSFMDPNSEIWEEYGTWTADAIAKKIGFKDAKEEVLDPRTQEMVSIEALIGRKPASYYKSMIKK